MQQQGRGLGLVLGGGMAATVLLGGCAAPAAPDRDACLLPRMQHMVEAELYFGREIPGSGGVLVSDAQWEEFVARELAPRFRDGFSVLEAKGEWLSPQTGLVAHEPGHVVRVWVEAQPDLAARLEAVASAYKTAFHQEAVGVSLVSGCARFSE